MSGHRGESQSRSSAQAPISLPLTTIIPLPRSDRLALSSPAMAYNREWDQGKQADYEAWQSGPRANTHMREEDYYGDSKRRKFNDGVRCGSLPFHEPRSHRA